MLGNALHKEDQVKSKKDWEPIQLRKKDDNHLQVKKDLSWNKIKPASRLENLQELGQGGSQMPYMCPIDYVRLHLVP